MDHSIIYLLVRKDFLLMRKYIFIYWCCGLLGIVAAIVISGLVAANFGFTILISAMCACGFHTLIHTVIEEKSKLTQIFIMSLPVTAKDYIIAKLLFNLAVFASIWAILSIAFLYVGIDIVGLPLGSLPIMCMLVLGIFLGYSLTLCVCVTTQSHGYTMIAILASSLITAIYLWLVVYLEPISAYVMGTEAVWNAAALTIMGGQILLSTTLLFLAVLAQLKKTNFI